MRKVFAILTVVVLLASLAMPAAAAEPRIVTIRPSLTFSDGIATCDVAMVGNTMNDELSATIRLYRGNTLIATWRVEGQGYITFNRTKSVAQGFRYKLTVDLIFNGEACSQVSQTAVYE